MITIANARTYLVDATEFFIKLHDYLQNRINAIEKGAQGKSKYVSQWLSIIARENVETVFFKLRKYDEEKLLYLDHKVKDQTLYKEIVAKTTAHLNRAHEFLTNVAEDADFGAYFIDVPAHRVLKQKADEMLTSCEALLTKYQLLADQTIPPAPKSWYANSLRIARALVGARVASFALPMQTPDLPAGSKAILPSVLEKKKPEKQGTERQDTEKEPEKQGTESQDTEQQDTEQKEIEAFARLLSIAERTRKICKIKVPSTKKTRQILGIEGPDDAPRKGSLHYQYCPKKMRSVVETFAKDLAEMDRHNLKQMKHEEIIDMLKLDYPTPERIRHAPK